MFFYSLSFYYLSILLLTLLAAFTRFYRLGKWSFWEDELFTIRHAIDISKNGFKAIDNCHPLYYLSIIPALRHFGVTEWSARSAATLIGTISVPILIFAIEPVVGELSALLFGLLLALSPWHVYWSQNARFYSMTFLFQFLALLNFYFWVETTEWYRLVLFLGIYAISVLAHETSAISLIVAFVYLLAVSIFPAAELSTATLLIAGSALLTAALYTVAIFLFLGGGFRKRKKTINSHWKIHYSHRRSGPLRILGGALKFMGIATTCIGLVWIVRHALFLSRFDLFVLTLMIVPLGVVIAGSFIAYATTRYSFLSLAGFLLAASNMILEFWMIFLWAGVTAGAILIVTALDDLALYYFTQNGNRERWREVLLQMKPRIKPHERVLTTTPDLAIHYLERPVRWLTEFDCQMLNELNGVNWFVLNDSVQALSPQVRQWLEQNTTLLLTDEVHYHMKSWTVSVRRYEGVATPAKIVIPSSTPEGTTIPMRTESVTIT